MSRLDYVTISIVVICLIALGFLVYKTIGLMTADPSQKKQQTEQTTDDSGDADTYNDVDSLASEDLDDDEVTGILDDPNDDTSEDELPEDASDLETEDTSAPIEDDTETDAADDAAEVEAPTRPASYDSGAYLVLAGSFRQEINADNQVKKLKANGFDNARVTKFNKSAYAVALVDRFDSRSEANALVKELEGKGFEALVKKQKN